MLALRRVCCEASASKAPDRAENGMRHHEDECQSSRLQLVHGWLIPWTMHGNRVVRYIPITGLVGEQDTILQTKSPSDSRLEPSRIGLILL